MGPARLPRQGARPRTERPGSKRGSSPTTARVAVEEEAMSYRELTMIDVKELLRRWAAQQGVRRIARETCTDRKTVGRYVDAAVKVGLPRDRELDETEIHQVAQRVQARPLPDASAEWEAVAR